VSASEVDMTLQAGPAKSITTTDDFAPLAADRARCFAVV